MDIEDVIAQIREAAQGSGSVALLNDEAVVLMSWIENMKAENAELRARLDKALDDMRTVTVTDINMRDLMELADRLDAQGQHPGFPRLQPTQEMVEDWLPFTEAANRLIERTLTLDLDDPDEPVAGTG